MCKYLKFIFVIPLFFIGCSEQEEEQEEELPYISPAWIMWDDLVDKEYCAGNQDSMFVDGTKAFYNPMSLTNFAGGGGCTHVEYCSYILYYKDLGYVDYKIATAGYNSSDSIYSYDLTEKTNVRYGMSVTPPTIFPISQP